MNLSVTAPAYGNITVISHFSFISVKLVFILFGKILRCRRCCLRWNRQVEACSRKEKEWY